MPPTPPTTPPLYRLADRLLEAAGREGGVGRLIRDMRADDASWRRIALEIRDRTEGDVDVTGETVRRWAEELDPEPSAA